MSAAEHVEPTLMSLTPSPFVVDDIGASGWVVPQPSIPAELLGPDQAALLVQRQQGRGTLILVGDRATWVGSFVAILRAEGYTVTEPTAAKASGYL